MKLAAHETETDALSALGIEAVELLRRGDFSALAARFGYALAFGRDVETAIREDLGSSLASLNAIALAPNEFAEKPIVKHLKGNDAALIAAIEARAATNNGMTVLVELVVSARGSEKFLTLEHISAA